MAFTSPFVGKYIFMRTLYPYTVSTLKVYVLPEFMHNTVVYMYKEMQVHRQVTISIRREMNL